jgi:ligand-binding sensor domain-containing protein
MMLGAASCSSHTDEPAQSTDRATANASVVAQTASAQPPAPFVAPPKPYKVEEGFSVGNDVYVRSLAIDPKRQSLWVGTSAGAIEVDLVTREVKNTFTRKDGLANEYVFALDVDSAGRTWFGTNGGGMSSYEDGRWRTFFPMHGLADYWVYSFAEQSPSVLWVGTWAGVNRYDLATGEFRTFVKELVNEWVYGITVDANSRVWFGTEGGVSMFDGVSWRSWTHADGVGAPNSQNLPPSTNTGLGTRTRHDLSVLSEGRETYNPGYVFAVKATADGGIWAGTWGGGVSRFDGTQWRNLSMDDGLAGNVVFSIAQEPGGALWFGTDRGASRFDGQAWANYSRSDGLLGDSVYAVEVTPAGEVWLGTRNGVTRLIKQP